MLLEKYAGYYTDAQGSITTGGGGVERKEGWDPTLIKRDARTKGREPPEWLSLQAVAA